MKRNLILLVFLFASFKLTAQTNPQSVNFKTPEVAAFERYIETPVSYFTGVPNISIPLYEIRMNGVNVPISLDYHAGGIRVDQEATWVGLGWSLNYGGTISRKVRGGADEYNFLFGGSYSSFMSVQDFNALPTWTTDPYLTQRTMKVRAAKSSHDVSVQNDFMPDEFYYSVLGHSGKFMFSQQQKKFIAFPKEDILIRDYGTNNTLNESYQNFHPLNSWNIITPDGISVDFGQDGTVSQSLGDNRNSGMVKTAWQIKNIRNQFNDNITFNYAGAGYEGYKLSGEKYSSMATPAPLTVTPNTFGEVLPTSIAFPGGSVGFTTSSREDLPSGTKKLSELDVYNTQGTVIKKVLFYYSYFYGSSFNALPTNYSSLIPANQQFERLRLDSIAVTASGVQPILYKFDYYTPANLPAKITYAQDHWGFFNGIPNSTLLPKIISSTYVASGDRRVKPENSNVFALKSMTNPEKGKTEFVYESNAARNTVPPEMASIYQDDNFTSKSATISFSGHNNNNLSPAPDISNPNQLYTYKQDFTVGPNVSTYSTNGWNFYTDYGVYNDGNIGPNPYGTGRVDFKLERINADNTRTTVKVFFASNLGNNAEPFLSQNAPLQLTPGNYEMTALAYPYNGYPPPSTQNNYSTTFTISWQETSITTPFNVGGLRIKQINYYNNDNSMVKKLNYSYVMPLSGTDPTLISSGQVASFPNYIQPVVQRTADDVHIIPNGIEIFANSIQPLESTSGSYCGYTNVSETQTDNNSTTLRTDYQFSFDPPIFSQYAASYQLTLVEPKEWERGKLISKKQFKGNNVIRAEDYTYYTWSPHLVDNDSEDYVEEINTDLISMQSATPAGGGNTVFGPDFYYWPDMFTQLATGYLENTSYQFRFNYGVDEFYQQDVANNVHLPYFKRYTGFDKMKTKTVTTYDDNGNSVVQSENYFYDSTPVHYELTRVEAGNSRNEIVRTINKYPFDYANITSTDAVSQGVKKLADTYAISSPVESSTYRMKADGSNSRFISSSFTTFKPTVPLPDKVNIIESNALITNFIPSSVQSGAVVSDNRYSARVANNYYDEHGNLLEQQKALGTPVNYIWSYNGQYPIAKIDNADYNTVITALGGATAVSTFRANPNPSDAAVNTFLAPLRTATSLKNAMVTTYTYFPLVGITTATDPKGLTTYYEYDSFQRLMNIKDKDGNIVKHIDYHYKGQ